MKNVTKTCLITGGCGDLGLFLAKQLRKQGFRIIIIDRYPLLQCSEKFNDTSSVYYQINFEDLSELEQTIGIILKKNEKIDLLINNAARRDFRSFMDYSRNDVEKYFNINFNAPLILSQRIIPIMRKNGFGRIVNIASVSGLKGYAAGSIYCSTKSALIRFTEAVGDELRKDPSDITMNVICPDSFKSLDGKEVKGYNEIREAILRAIVHLLESDVNGKVIPIMLPKNRVIHFIKNLKENFYWLFQQ